MCVRVRELIEFKVFFVGKECFCNIFHAVCGSRSIVTANNRESLFTVLTDIYCYQLYPNLCTPEEVTSERLSVSYAPMRNRAQTERFVLFYYKRQTSQSLDKSTKLSLTTFLQ